MNAGSLNDCHSVLELLYGELMLLSSPFSPYGSSVMEELIVHENDQVMSIGYGLDAASGVQDDALRTLEVLIKLRASKSHEELFEICPLEAAHLLSHADTEAVVKGADTKSLVYGEINFWSFYDVVRAAADGINTVASNMDSTRTGETSCRELSRAVTPSTPCLTPNKVADGRRIRRERDEINAGALDTRTASRAPGTERRRGLKFYDLGSGSGKAVFAAVLAADFRYAVGIELLAGVHRASTRVLRRYRRLVEPVLSSPAVIDLHHGSFLSPEFDWTDGDLIFANSTCFTEDTLEAIAARAVGLRRGARVVTFTTALRAPWLRVLSRRRYMMSWGPATVFVHERVSGPEEGLSESIVEDGAALCFAGRES